MTVRLDSQARIRMWPHWEVVGELRAQLEGATQASLARDSSMSNGDAVNDTANGTANGTANDSGSGKANSGDHRLASEAHAADTRSDDKDTQPTAHASLLTLLPEVAAIVDTPTARSLARHWQVGSLTTLVCLNRSWTATVAAHRGRTRA